MSDLMFSIRADIDTDQLARDFSRNGHVRIRDLLTADTAVNLHTGLRTRQDWHQLINAGDKIFELDRETRAAMSAEQTTSLEDAIIAGARSGFQYRYETIRVPDPSPERTRSDDPVAKFAAWLSSKEPADLLRRITGKGDIAFADAQATAYSPGDFLTGHDDDVAGKNRRAAYVFGLTPEWRTEWGGLLLFHHEDRIEGQVPAFNCLDLLAVPQLHSVSQVTQSAAYRRYSITGWLRAEH
jgi:SM-20-related protein